MIAERLYTEMGLYIQTVCKCSFIYSTLRTQYQIVNPPVPHGVFRLGSLAAGSYGDGSASLPLLNGIHIVQAPESRLQTRDSTAGPVVFGLLSYTYGDTTVYIIQLLRNSLQLHASLSQVCALTLDGT